jgi:hypothetical protein
LDPSRREQRGHFQPTLGVVVREPAMTASDYHQRSERYGATSKLRALRT